MRALSIRQPWAELILRGIKTVEYRSQPTRIIGERFHIYASRGGIQTRRPADGEKGRSKAVSLSELVPFNSDNLDLESPPAWLVELAEQMKLIRPGHELPTGVIVGSAVIAKVSPPDARDSHGMYRWHLAGVERAKSIRKPRGHPQPVWFRPF